MAYLCCVGVEVVICMWVAETIGVMGVVKDLAGGMGFTTLLNARKES